MYSDTHGIKNAFSAEKDVAKILYSRENWVKFDYKT